MHGLDAFKVVWKVFDFKVQQRRYRLKEKVIVNTKYGPVEGIKRRSVYGDFYYSFERIPFAKPPLGELRYKAPQPPEPWSQVRPVQQMGPIPLQRHYVFKLTYGSEDCLYLNVYTKNINPETPQPVMVWIFGGGFQHGEATRSIYAPDYLLKEDVVIVTIAYRLGPLGFLSLEDPALDVPGNAGLKDQVMALRWVKDNCRFFGGDSENITLFGESAGGASVHYMMITEQTRGLFHKAIAMSGCALASWSLSPPRQWPFRLAKAAGYLGSNNERDILDFLKRAKGSRIIEAYEELYHDDEKKERIYLTFGPVVEPYITPHCVVPKRPLEMMRTTWSNSIPMILGGVANEGLLVYTDTKTNPKFLNGLGDCRYVVPYELQMDRESQQCVAYGAQIRKTYYGDKTPGLSVLDGYIKMVTHEYFWFPVYRTVLSRSEYALNAPTYLYRFAFDSKYFNHMRILMCGKKMRGTCHGDDLSYLFYNSLAKRLNYHSDEYRCIQSMVGMWTHFATYGDPNHDRKNPNIWLPVSPVGLKKGQLKCLNVADELKMIDVPDLQELQMWEKFYTPEQLI